MPYLWFWQEFGASRFYPWYGRNYNVGLEPFSSHPTNGIEEAIENGSALSVDTPMLRWAADLFKGRTRSRLLSRSGAGCIPWEGLPGEKRSPR
jgi:hypothetical protein